MSADGQEDTERVGYKLPPAATRFKPGQSGNPRGRPRGKHSQLPFEAVLGQKVTVREDGLERRVTAAEAFILHLVKRGLEGDGAAARAALAAIDQARQSGFGTGPPALTQIVFKLVTPGAVSNAAEKLGMARKLDRYRPGARLLLEPWIVEAALARLDRRLTREEQKTVVAATRTPARVRWPEWWEALP